MKGLFHWRLLGAHLLRRRAGCLQPENSGPFVLAAAPILLTWSRARAGPPAPLCSAPAILFFSRWCMGGAESKRERYGGRRRRRGDRQKAYWMRGRKLEGVGMRRPLDG